MYVSHSFNSSKTGEPQQYATGYWLCEELKKIGGHIKNLKEGGKSRENGWTLSFDCDYQGACYDIWVTFSETGDSLFGEEMWHWEICVGKHRSLKEILLFRNRFTTKDPIYIWVQQLLDNDPDIRWPEEA